MNDSRNDRKKRLMSAMATVLALSVEGSQAALPTATGVSPLAIVDVHPSDSRESDYANGTYTATGQYGVGPSFVTVTVELTDGLITSALVQPHAKNLISRCYQRHFAKAVPRAVIGKPIDQVKLGKLAGSSSTPDGFNAAIEQIKAQAVASPTAPPR